MLGWVIMRVQKIVSACCGATLRWKARAAPGRVATGEVYNAQPQTFVPIYRQVPGKTIRAYVCEQCGKTDR